jgi:hypothetical protein
VNALPDYVPGAPCPCGCGATASRLSVKTGHVRGTCKCRPCIGSRNQRKGKRGQAKTHRALGGTSFTPHHEESGRPYTIEVSVLPEVKTGAQIPASWAKFIATDWWRRAYSQSERGAPIGTGVLPAVVLEGRWCIVDLKPRKGERVA